MDRPQPSPWENRVVLEGVLTETGDLRVTPSGLEVVTLTVEHLSARQDLPPLERLAVQMQAVACGVLAGQVKSLLPGSRIRLEGSLNQRRFLRRGKISWGRLELQLKGVRLLAEPANQAGEDPDGPAGPA